jgi:flagellar motor switch protein FliG
VANELSNAQKAAMLVMSLEEEQAADLLKHMSESTVAKLREAADSLAAGKIGDKEKRQALLGFFQHKRKGTFFVGNADERFRRVLEQAKGKEMVQRLYSEEADTVRAALPEQSPLDYIMQFPEEQMAKVLQKESPRCAAALLSHLDGRKSGRILNLLEDEMREAVVERLISSEVVPAEVAGHVIAAFKKKLDEIGSEAEAASEEKRAMELAGMIGTLTAETQEKVLARMAERDPEMAQKVERLMFSFNDLLHVSERSMQELLRNVEVAHVALALKGAGDEMQKHFSANLSQRQLERVAEEREMSGRVPMSKVEEAREEVMKLARKMRREGQLVVETGEEQYVE